MVCSVCIVTFDFFELWLMGVKLLSSSAMGALRFACLRAGVIASAATGAESASEISGEDERVARTACLAGADCGTVTFLALGVVVVDLDRAMLVVIEGKCEWWKMMAVP